MIKQNKGGKMKTKKEVSGRQSDHNQKVSIKVLEERTENEVDLQKIADYLGWKLIEEEGEIIPKTLISREKNPRICLWPIGENNKAITVHAEKSKDESGCFAFLQNITEVEFEKFQRIKNDKSIKQSEQ